MSRIYFHQKSGEDGQVRGSERAYMGILCQDLALATMGGSFFGNTHPLQRFLAPGTKWPEYGQDEAANAAHFLSGFFGDNFVQLNDIPTSAFSLVLNTILAMGSPQLSLLAKIHGTCEIHGWFAEEDRDWLAHVIHEGRTQNVFRPDQGWEDLMTMIDLGEGPIVMSYSVTDGFPHMPTNWLPVVDSTFVVDSTVTLTDVLSEEWHEQRYEKWDELSSDERWDIAFAALDHHGNPPINADTVSEFGFEAGISIFDLKADPRWYAREEAS